MNRATAPRYVVILMRQKSVVYALCTTKLRTRSQAVRFTFNSKNCFYYNQHHPNAVSCVKMYHV